MREREPLEAIERRTAGNCECQLLAESEPSLNPPLTRYLSNMITQNNAAEGRQEKCLLPVYCQLPYGMPNLSIYRLDFSLTG